MGIAQGKGRLKPYNAERSGFKLRLFLMSGMRSMVGGDAVYGAVCQSLFNRLTVLCGTQGRVHFGIGVVAEAGLLCEYPVMGAGLAGNRQAFCFGLAQSLHGSCRGDVQEVK